MQGKKTLYDIIFTIMFPRESVLARIKIKEKMDVVFRGRVILNKKINFNFNNDK